MLDDMRRSTSKYRHAGDALPWRASAPRVGDEGSAREPELSLPRSGSGLPYLLQRVVPRLTRCVDLCGEPCAQGKSRNLGEGSHEHGARGRRTGVDRGGTRDPAEIVMLPR